MPITQLGQINTTALVVPDLYVQIVPPQNIVINGVNTGIVGVVGTASYGPVNVATILSGTADLTRNFGPVMARNFDLATPVVTAIQQGASSFFAVRVTDGTDVAATGSVSTAGATVGLILTAIYTGSFGNNVAASIVTGSKAGSYAAVITCPGQPAERFDNITGTAGALWTNFAAAINGGNATRGPSQIVVAAAGASVTLPNVGTVYAFAAGTDGATGVTASTLVGVDAVGARTGMYALRGKGCSVGVLSDTFDATTWTLQVAFGLSEGVYMMLTGPKGDTITNAIAAKATAGLDSYAAKLHFGDWLYWNDTTNALPTRLVSPQGFAAGKLANMSPERSTLNKPLFGIVGSQRLGLAGSAQQNAYSAFELSLLFAAGIDVITNPGAGGLAVWTERAGHNSSSNAATGGDNYTRMTNYIAATLSVGMGVFVGRVINSALFFDVRSTLLSFLQGMLGQNQLGSTDGSTPFGVVCDISNNPAARTGNGYVQADVQVRYQAINEKFIVNLEGGQTVNVARQTTASGQVSQ